MKPLTIGNSGVFAAIFFAIFGFISDVSIAQNKSLSPAHDHSKPLDSKDRVKALEPLLVNENYIELSKNISALPIYTQLKWLKSKMEEGRSAYLGWLYANKLWALAGELKAADPKFSLTLSEMAGSAVVYTYLLTKIDGMRCVDTTSPQRRTTQVLTQYRPVIDFLKKQNSELRKNVIDIAFSMELRTKDRRKNDAFLCGFGLNRIATNLEAGAKPRFKGKDSKGTHHYSVDEAKPYKIAYHSKEKYEELQIGLRGKLREFISKLLLS